MTESDQEFSLGHEIERVKLSLGIIKPNAEMSDSEIALVSRTLAERADDTEYDENDKPIFGDDGITIMLTTALYYFPKFYERNLLSQWQ